MGKVNIYDGLKDTVIEFAITDHKKIGPGLVEYIQSDNIKRYKRSKFKFYEPKEKSISEKLWGK